MRYWFRWSWLITGFWVVQTQNDLFNNISGMLVVTLWLLMFLLFGKFHQKRREKCFGAIIVGQNFKLGMIGTTMTIRAYISTNFSRKRESFQKWWLNSRQSVSWPKYFEQVLIKDLRTSFLSDQLFGSLSAFDELFPP